jgi:hypothetical protein
MNNYFILLIGSETYFNQGDESSKLFELSSPNFLPKTPNVCR